METVSKWIASWRLKSWRTAAVTALLFYTLTGFVVVPWVVKSLIVKTVREQVDREAGLERVAFNPFTLSLTMEGFSLPDRPGSTLLSFDELFVNLQASSLFTWTATVEELRVQGPYVALRRFEDGKVNVLELMESLETDEVDDKEGGGLPRALLRKIRIVDGRVEVESLVPEEPLLWELTPVNLSLNNISTLPGEEGDNLFTLGTPNGGEIGIDGTVVVEPLGLEGSVSVERMPIETVWRAVKDKFEFDLSSGSFATDLDYRIGVEEDGVHVEVLDAELRIRDFGFQTLDADTELLKADAITISGADVHWPEQRIRVDSLVVEGASAFAWIEPDGTPIWMTLVPEPTQKQVADAYRYVDDRVDLDAKLDLFELRGATAAFEDRTFSEPVRIAVSEANLRVTDIATRPNSVWRFETSAVFAGGAQASADGSFSAIPLVLDAEVALADLELSRFQPYVEKFAPLEVRAGVLHTDGSVHVEPSPDAPDVTFSGALSVNRLDLDETVTDDTLIGWGALDVTGIQAALAPTSLGIEQVEARGAGLEITVAEDGTINLLEFLKVLSEGESTDASEPIADAEAGGGLPPVQIASLRLHDCYGLYTDKTTADPFRMNLRSINGTVSGIATEANSTADIDIDGALDGYGLLSFQGELDLFNYARLTDFNIDIYDMALPFASPMSVKVIGHPIESGRLTLDLDYNITDQQLQATNHIELSHLHLGDKIEGEGTIDAPFKLGISMLKDSDGRITLDIPLEGNLDDPDFIARKAVMAAAGEVTKELVKSPFRMLGRLVGGGAEDQELEFVDFEVGSASLGTSATANLDTLARALKQRPTLRLEIESVVDRRADSEVLKQTDFERELATRQTAAEQSEATTDRTPLETMFVERFSAADLESLRAQYTSAEDSELDDDSYTRVLRSRLVESQPVDEARVAVLGLARAEAISSFLQDQAGIGSARLGIRPKPTESPAMAGRVRTRLEVTADS